ncbi:MiaB/RimO family radical SAM methylthiotransferase [bacterium]|nr:MiaB/RimO family radical SAM methylthiotransferase [bacterium]
MENIKTLSFGCRLNALESEKIQAMLAPHVGAGIVINTCAVTAEAERQSAQSIRKIARENPNVPLFITGCAATRNPDLFRDIPHAIVIANQDKRNLDAYVRGLRAVPCGMATPDMIGALPRENNLSKKFIQVQNGCNHACAYCVTRLLRGPSVSFDYADIVADARAAVAAGFYEVVLTGVDSASYARDGRLIGDVCADLLRDVPEIQRLRLSSMDPASPQIFNIIDLMHRDARMMPHLHLSMQAGSDPILAAMGRRHTADMVRQIVAAAPDVTFSWDIICGFPGETDELFRETLELARELGVVRIHAFPFSPRPGTPAADMPGQVLRATSKSRVHQIMAVADAARATWMAARVGQVVSVLVENDNMARDPHDMPVRIVGAPIVSRTICDVELTDVRDDMFIGRVV